MSSCSNQVTIGSLVDRLGSGFPLRKHPASGSPAEQGQLAARTIFEEPHSHDDVDREVFL